VISRSRVCGARRKALSGLGTMLETVGLDRDDDESVRAGKHSKSWTERVPVKEIRKDSFICNRFCSERLWILPHAVNCVRFCFWRCLLLFVWVWNISGTAERICAKFTEKTWFIHRSDEFEWQGQRSKVKVTRDKNGIFFGPFGCLRAVYVL